LSREMGVDDVHVLVPLVLKQLLVVEQLTCAISAPVVWFQTVTLP